MNGEFAPLVHCDLDFDSSCARKARQVVRATLPESEQRDSLELIASELVTNAYTHGTGLISLSLSQSPSTWRISVVNTTDASRGNYPVEQKHVALEAEHGRGLALVNAASSAWGYSVNEDTVTTWAEVDRES